MGWRKCVHWVHGSTTQTSKQAEVNSPSVPEMLVGISLGKAVWMVMKGSSVNEVSCAATEAARKTAHAIGRTNMVNEWYAVCALLEKVQCF